MDVEQADEVELPVVVADARPVLTRVAVTLPRREPATAWCRHEVRRLVLGHLIALVAGVALLVALIARVSGTGWGSAIAFGLLVGILAALAGVGFVLLRGPRGIAQLRRSTTSPPEYLLTRAPLRVSPTVPAAATASAAPAAVPAGSAVADLPDVWDLPDAEPIEPTEPTEQADPQAEHVHTAVDAPGAVPSAAVEPTGSRPPVVRLTHDDGSSVGDRTGDPSVRARATIDAIRELGFGPVASLQREGRKSSVVELFADGGLVVAAVDHATGRLTLLTELVGFRVLVTSDLLVPPTDDLVVNVVEDPAPSSLVVSHRRLVQSAVRCRTLPSEPVGLFKLAQQRELEAFRQLGPFWGAMLDLRCRTGSVRLASAPSADDVLLFTGNRLYQQTT